MRLTPAQIKAIKLSVLAVDEKASVYLFGSRVDVAKSGGDIDLLIESNKIEIREKLRLLGDLKRTIGDRKIDVIVTKSIETETDPFVLSILDEMVKL